MKKYYMFAFCYLITLLTFGQVNEVQNKTNKSFPEPVIDKRIELLSIVFRLAGNFEYSSIAYSSYVQDIHSHFDKYSDHPVISFASKLRIENGVSFDAVMKMAFHINQPPTLSPKVNFSENVPDQRWGAVNANKFLELLSDFYNVSDFERFYYEHKGLYEIAKKRFSSVYEAVHIEWFNNYYGVKPEGSYHVIISLGNGGSSYGGKVIYSDAREESYSILGTWVIDSTDLPVYSAENYLPTLIHEFNHSYVNPLIDKYETQLESSGKIIFEPIQDILKRQAYGEWNVMMYESLVRASVIRYLLRYDSYEAAKKQLIADMGRGFYWMKDLVNLLHDYEEERNNYKTMESFMPVIIEFFNKTAIKSETIFEIKR